MVQFCFCRIENIFKMEKCWPPTFSLFPNPKLYSEASYHKLDVAENLKFVLRRVDLIKIVGKEENAG